MTKPTLPEPINEKDLYGIKLEDVMAILVKSYNQLLAYLREQEKN